MTDPNDLEERISELERENMILDSKVLELYTLYNISKRLGMATQLDEIFNGTMEVISHSLSIDDFCIMLLNDSRDKLVLSASHGDEFLDDVSFDIGEGVTGNAVLTGDLRVIQDVSRCDEFLFYKGQKKNIGSFLCVPLKCKSGLIIGTLNVHKAEPNALSERDIELFSEVSDQIASAINKAISYKNMEELSIRDELTGLYNRRYFFEYFEKEIASANRRRQFIALILIDIDNFKNFNDKNGHILGDNALRSVASILQNNIRTCDVSARYGGEEFIVLLPETDKDGALKLAEKLKTSILHEYIKGQENQPGGNLTASFGVATFPDDAVYATELLDCADRAMYQGKSLGKNIVVSFNN